MNDVNIPSKRKKTKSITTSRTKNLFLFRDILRAVDIDRHRSHASKHKLSVKILSSYKIPYLITSAFTFHYIVFKAFICFLKLKYFLCNLYATSHRTTVVRWLVVQLPNCRLAMANGHVWPCTAEQFNLISFTSPVLVFLDFWCFSESRSCISNLKPLFCAVGWVDRIWFALYGTDIFKYR